MSEPLSVAFTASVKSVRTATDGGFVVSFDVPDTDAAAAAKLMVEFKEKVLSIAVVVAPR